MIQDDEKTGTEAPVTGGPGSCARGTCLAGVIGTASVPEKDWYLAAQRFEGKIELWNELTKRHAIPHIGFIQPFKFCPVCGHAIDHDALSPSKVISKLVEALRSELDGTVALSHQPLEKLKALEALDKANAWLRGPSYAHLFDSGLGEKETEPVVTGLDE